MPILFLFHPSFDPHNLLFGIQVESISSSSLVVFHSSTTFHFCPWAYQLHPLSRSMNECYFCFVSIQLSKDNLLLIQVESTSNNSCVLFYSCKEEVSFTTFGTCPWADCLCPIKNWSTWMNICHLWIFFVILVLIHTPHCPSKWRAIPTTPLCYSTYSCKDKLYSQPLVHVHKRLN
jgi:hypothetical protein